jgi:hypothetical protein
MVNEILAVLRNKLNEFLQSARPQAERWVLLGNAGLRDGGEVRDVSNKMIMSLVNLQSDARAGNFVAPQLTGDDSYFTGYPPLHLDAYIIIAANFTDANYEAGVALLSMIISFFQQTPVFTHENAPSLPPEMDKLVIEFVSLDTSELSHLLTATGSKYVPMVLYRLRRLPFAGPSVVGVAPAIRSAGAADAKPAG